MTGRIPRVVPWVGQERRGGMRTARATVDYSGGAAGGRVGDRHQAVARTDPVLERQCGAYGGDEPVVAAPGVSSSATGARPPISPFIALLDAWSPCKSRTSDAAQATSSGTRQVPAAENVTRYCETQLVPSLSQTSPSAQQEWLQHTPEAHCSPKLQPPPADPQVWPAPQLTFTVPPCDSTITRQQSWYRVQALPNGRQHPVGWPWPATFPQTVGAS